MNLERASINFRIVKNINIYPRGTVAIRFGTPVDPDEVHVVRIISKTTEIDRAFFVLFAHGPEWDHSVMPAMSLRQVQDGTVLIQVWVRASSANDAHNLVQSAWQIFCLHCNVQIMLPPSFPMQCPPSNIAVNVSRLLRLFIAGDDGGGLLGMSPLKALDMYPILPRVHYGLAFEHDYDPFGSKNLQKSFLLTSICKGSRLEHWRAPVYTILMWLIKEYPGDFHGMSFVILADRALVITLYYRSDGSNKKMDYLDDIFPFFDVEEQVLTTLETLKSLVSAISLKN